MEKYSSENKNLRLKNWNNEIFVFWCAKIYNINIFQNKATLLFTIKLKIEYI